MKITWDDKICQHAGVCVRTLPSVFQVKDGKFVIIQDRASGSKGPRSRRQVSVWRPTDPEIGRRFIPFISPD